MVSKREIWLNEMQNALPKMNDDETPDPDDIAAHVVAWDFDRALRTFQANKADMIETLGVRRIILRHDDLVVQEWPTFGTIRR